MTVSTSVVEAMLIAEKACAANISPVASVALLNNPASIIAVPSQATFAISAVEAEPPNEAEIVTKKLSATETAPVPSTTLSQSVAVPVGAVRSVADKAAGTIPVPIPITSKSVVSTFWHPAHAAEPKASSII